MAGPTRRRWRARLGFAAVLASISFAVLSAAPAAPSAAALSRWTGGIDLYRSGVFTTQQTWLWCTAADIQIIRNIVDHRSDHTRTSQGTYFDYMRAHDTYRIPISDGVDPGGWTAGLRHFVDSRYRLAASRSFDDALRSAVTNLRRTSLPVAITVSHGNHAWVLTGFTATADPATTSHFTVTSVRVTGPLWGLQSRSYGYDMAPDRKLTPSQLRGFFTPWHYARIHMAWEGRWVSVQPIGGGTSVAAAAPKPTPKPTSRPTPRATPKPTPTASPTASLAATTDVSASESPDTAFAGLTGAGPSSAAAAPSAAAVAEPAATSTSVSTVAYPPWLPVLALSMMLAGGIVLVGLLNARRIRS
jgi:hypothetical protein